jgi:hypothetical protein
MDHSACMFRMLLGLFDPEKDPSKRRETFNLLHGGISQKSRSNATVRTSPLGTLDVFVLEPKNLADVRRLGWPNAVIMLEVSCGGSGGGVGMNKPAPPTRRWFMLYRYTQKLVYTLTIQP